MRKNLLKKFAVFFLAGMIVSQPLLATAITLDPGKTPTEQKEPAATETMQAAMKEFKSLSRKERKQRISDAKKVLKQYKKDKKEGKAEEASTNTILLVILAIILPPLAVYLHEGEINSKFWIDLVLTLLFWIPGLIYALIVILS